MGDHKDGIHMSLIRGEERRKMLTTGTKVCEYEGYTGCPRRNGQNFGRVFLMLNYTDITQNTYIQS